MSKAKIDITVPLLTDMIQLVTELPPDDEAILKYEYEDIVAVQLPPLKEPVDST